MAERLDHRLKQLKQERQISAARPIVVGGALIIPIGLLLDEQERSQLIDRRVTEAIAMQAVMQAEIALGNDPRDVSRDSLGYDIESRAPQKKHGGLRFIEVKGRRADARTVTLTRNELMRALNSPQQFILALVEVEGARARPPRYLHGYPFYEPDPLSDNVGFDLQELLKRCQAPG